MDEIIKFLKENPKSSGLDILRKVGLTNLNISTLGNHIYQGRIVSEKVNGQRLYSLPKEK